MQKTDDFDMSKGERGIENHIQCSEKENLYLVTPKYLTPYLEFIRDNKRIYSTALKHVKLFGRVNTFNYMYEKIFSPILDRYGVSEKEKPYLVKFYINGLIAIVNEWIKNDCRESIDEIIGIINTCMKNK